MVHLRTVDLAEVRHTAAAEAGLHIVGCAVEVADRPAKFPRVSLRRELCIGSDAHRMTTNMAESARQPLRLWLIWLLLTIRLLSVGLLIG